MHCHSGFSSFIIAAKRDRGLCPSLAMRTASVPRNLVLPPLHTCSLDSWAIGRAATRPEVRRRTSSRRVGQDSRAGPALGSPGCRGAHVGTQKLSRGAPRIAVRVAATAGVRLESVVRPGVADPAGGLPTR